MTLVCLKGVLVTPFILSTEHGNYDVEEEKFYNLGETYYYQLDTDVYPYRIIKGIRCTK